MATPRSHDVDTANRDRRRVTQQEVDELEAQGAAALATDRPFIPLITLMVKGRKPGQR